MRWSPAFLVTGLGLGLLLTSCDQATGPRYGGAPLYSVSGQMLLAGEAPPDGPVRLAVAWYPAQAQNSAPSAILTQEVEYQGSFPLDYTFSFFDAPPAAALSAGEQNATWGVLLAYQDLNENGSLDLIPEDGSPIDKVLGASTGDYYNGAPPADSVYVAYIDGEPPSGWSGFSSGYNLWNGAVLPAGTSVPIVLEGTNELDFFVCESLMRDGWDGVGLPCNIAPTGGVHIGASIGISDGYAFASVLVSDGVNPLTDATVTLNGHALPFLAELGGYVGDGSEVLTAAENELSITPAGGEARIFHLTPASEFDLLSPAPFGADRVLGGDDVRISWSVTPDAQSYSVWLADSQTGAPDASAYVYPNGMAHESVDLPTPAADRYETVAVSSFGASSFARGLGGSWAQMLVTHSSVIDLVGPGLGATGSLSRYTYDGETADSAWLTAFEGTSELVDADLAVNGNEVPFDNTYRVFYTETPDLLTLAAENQVSMTVGDQVVNASVLLPGDFEVTAPADGTVDSDIELSWTAADQAAFYYVAMSDQQGNSVLAFSTTELAATLSGIPAGGFYLTVAAYGASTDRHFDGSVQKTFDLTVSE